jgi:hypothetical protein
MKSDHLKRLITITGSAYCIIFLFFHFQELEEHHVEGADSDSDSGDNESSNTDFNNPSQYVQYLKSYKVRAKLY